MGLLLISPNISLANPNNIVINEIMTGQTGASKNEFIELYNPTENDVNLEGYKLKKKTKSGNESNLVSSSKFIGNIPANGYFLIAHPDYQDTINADLSYSGSSYSIASNNTIILYDNDDNIIDKVGYGEAFDSETQAAPNPENDQSIERTSGIDTDNNNDNFIIQTTPSPQNSSLELTQTPLTTPISTTTPTVTNNSGNHPPFAIAGPNITALTNQEILFDASDSYDRSNDPLTYFWNFGNGATDNKKITSHTYTHPGQYLVTLIVSDGVYESIDIITVNIYNHSVIISEIHPDWIELYNQSDSTANLNNWMINDFIFPPGSFIGPKQFLVFDKKITNIDFNNDQVKLIYPDGSIGTEVNYSSKNRQNSCVAFNGSDYYWSLVPTPGIDNIISNQLESPKNFSVNNPKVLDDKTNNLTEKGTFKPQESSTTSLLTQIPDNIQSASIAQLQQNTKSNLITYILIITSASLIISWIAIRIRKRIIH